MKVRISEHNLRYRLSEEDLNVLAVSGQVRLVLALPNTTGIIFEILLSSDEQQGLHFAGGVFQLVLSDVKIKKWISAEENGYYLTVAADEKPVSIAIEKDLPCKH